MSISKSELADLVILRIVNLCEKHDVRFDRVWCMPNKNTFTIKPIKELIIEEVNGYGICLDPFANDNTIKKIICNENLKIVTNDLNSEFNTDYNTMAVDFLKMFDKNSVDYVIFDPPYSNRQISECYNGVGLKTTMKDTQASFWSNPKKEISRIVKVGGKVISFGWNSGGIGKTRGFRLDRILLVNHGGSHNDTIVTVETKIKNA